MLLFKNKKERDESLKRINERSDVLRHVARGRAVVAIFSDGTEVEQTIVDTPEEAVHLAEIRNR